MQAPPVFRTVGIDERPKLTVPGAVYNTNASECQHSNGVSYPRAVTDSSHLHICGAITHVEALPGLEDQTLPVSGISIHSNDPEDRYFKVDLSVEHGTLSIGGSLTSNVLSKAVFGTKGRTGSQLSFEGQLETCNALLVDLTYLGHRDWFGRDTLEVNVQDVSVGHSFQIPNPFRCRSKNRKISPLCTFRLVYDKVSAQNKAFQFCYKMLSSSPMVMGMSPVLL